MNSTCASRPKIPIEEMMFNVSNEIKSKRKSNKQKIDIKIKKKLNNIYIYIYIYD
jgi:hypothetical protein